MLIVLLFGFSSGLPLALSGSTLQAWMAKEKIDLTTIGLISLVGIPYSLKPLWAPLMDRYIPPFLGRRRGWILITQILLCIAILSVSQFDPINALSIIAVLAFLIAFLSASQDIVIDAYRVEILKTEEFGLGASLANMGYRIALIVTGGIALILSDQFPWQQVYQFMAAAMLIGLIATWYADEPEASPSPKNLKDAVFLPLIDFLNRPKVFEVATFVFLYKLDAVFASALVTPFLTQLGFSGTEIGSVFKIYGVVATIVGTFVGGAFLTRLGLLRSLWTFGILQGLAGLSFFFLAHLGRNYPMMVTAITAENFFSGMGTSAYAAFLMSLCNKKFTATQFALVSSLMALTRSVGTSYSGAIAKNFGWEIYFIISILIAVPALALLLRYNVWMKARPQD